jgi:hypothetical protein
MHFASGRVRSTVVGHNFLSVLPSVLDALLIPSTAN